MRWLAGRNDAGYQRERTLWWNGALRPRSLPADYFLVLVHIWLLARRRANSRYRSQISAQFLNINSGIRVRDAAADDSVQFVGAQFAHCQSPDVPGRAHSSP